jgi:hypothetical protein
METTLKKRPSYISGTILALFAIPLLIAFNLVQETTEKSHPDKVEFTDVRIIRLDSSRSQYEPEIARQLTIHSDSTYSTLWSQLDQTNAIPCPGSFKVQIQQQPRNQLMNHFGNPLL